MLRLAFVGVILLHSAVATSAADWPTKPIRLVAPVAPGISTDAIARVFADKVSQELGQQLYVDNIAGAAGVLGTSTVARAAPDGYTALFATAGMLAMNKYLFKKLPFDLDRDLVGVATVCRNAAFALAVSARIPVATLSELIDLAKKKPGDLSYAIDVSSGIAGIIGELLNRRAGISMVQVPYKTTSQAITDTIAGTPEMIIGSVTSFDGFVRAGQLRLVAVTTAERAIGYENIATVSETMPGFQFQGWSAVVVPAGTPQPNRDRLGGVVNQIARNASKDPQLSALNCNPAPREEPGDADRFLHEERERWGGIAKEIDLQAQ